MISGGVFLGLSGISTGAAPELAGINEAHPGVGELALFFCGPLPAPNPNRRDVPEIKGSSGGGYQVHCGILQCIIR